ncbi:MAG: DUF4886 domain-containing protein [Ruminococcaceae bacterium]|nr:DUF4886 domain-containing protein [Oscillospiraceae bacterium]
MNVLCIGNSFSQDATRYLHQVSGEELFVRNLYIGGCSLERHYNNIVGDVADYEYQKNGRCLRMISIAEALKKKKWDYITVQQVSQDSGIIDTYEPFLGEIVKYLKENCPSAKIVLHRTWAYAQTSDHGGFVNYDRDRKRMYNAIVDTTNKIAEKYGFDIIPCGDAIEMASALPEFELGAELSMHRDGFHLSLDYGRYLAALVMNKYFTGKNPMDVEYEPENTNHEIILKLKKVAADTIAK